MSRLITIDSTNDELARRCLNGTASNRSVLAADEQTAGRGRLDRRWDAPSGSNLLFSVLFAPPISDPQRLQHAVALAVLESVKTLGVAEATLKWPNDVMVNVEANNSEPFESVKLAGMLSTMTPNGSVIVGTGCNVNWAPDGATSILEQSATRHEVAEVLRLILTALDKMLSLASEELDEIYRTSVDTIGRQVRVELPNGEFVTGRATRLDVDGALEVIDECAITHRFHAGDVIHLRAQG